MMKGLLKHKNLKLVQIINRGRIIKIIQEKRSVSQADLARITSLNPATVLNIVRYLIKKKIVKKTDLGISTGGRKPQMLQLNKDYGYIIGIDIERKYFTVFLCDITANLLEEKRVNIAKRDFPSIMNDVINIIKSLKNKYEKRNKILGIGISLPGLVDSKHGVMLVSAYFKRKNFPITSFFKSHFDVRVCCESTLKTKILGEAWFGKGVDVDDLMLVEVGDGIGISAIMDKRLYSGNHNMAGEIGHISINPEGPLCGCGQKGCLELYVNKEAILKKAKKEIRKNINIKLFSELLDKGNKDALKIANDVIANLGYAISNAINTLDPQRVIFSGELVESSKSFYELLIKHISDNNLIFRNNSPELVISELKEKAITCGITALVLRETFKFSTLRY